MDTLVLLGSFFALMLIGVPIAYSLGLSALIGALWIELPFDAVMIQVASGVNKFSLLAIPFFVLAGAIMAEGGMARRLVAFAGVLVGFIRGGCHWSTSWHPRSSAPFLVRRWPILPPLARC